MEPPPIHQPHDSFFKKALGVQKAAKEILQWQLPESIKKRVNFDTLKRESGEHFDQKLKKNETDILYSADMNGETAYFYFLVEHQSSVDQDMPYRAYQYQNSIIKQHRAKGRKAPYPYIHVTVIYDGNQKWTVAKNFAEHFGNNEDLVKQHGFGSYDVLELRSLDDAALADLAASGYALYALKSRWNKNDRFVMKKVALYRLELTKNGDEEMAVIFTRYVLDQRPNIKEEDFETVEEELEKENPEASMQVLPMKNEIFLRGRDEGISRGKAEGKTEGKAEAITDVAKNMLALKMSIETVSKATGLSVDEIAELEAVTESS